MLLLGYELLLVLHAEYVPAPVSIQGDLDTGRLAATAELCQELAAPLLSLGVVHKGCKKQAELTGTCWSICLNVFLEKIKGQGGKRE